MVLGDFDAVRILMADGDGDFLRQCRVLFVLGPEPVTFESMYGDTTLMSEENQLELQGETAPGDQPQ